MGILTSPVTFALILTISIWIGFFQKKFKSGGAVDPEWLKRDLSGKTAIVTGGNVGVGYETALQLARQGATVIIASRDTTKATDAVNRINSITNSNHAQFIHPLDLSSFKSIRAFAEKLKDTQINYLINNAGVMTPEHATTTEGFEIQFGTNHLGHFLLTKLLLDQIKKTNGRVINVSSAANLFCLSVDFDKIRGNQSDLSKGHLYGRSKLANILFSKELAERGILSYSLHPGAVKTELARHMPAYHAFTKYFEQVTLMIFKTPYEGAQTSLYAVLCDENEVPSGSYLYDCKAVEGYNPLTRDKDLQHKLWKISEEAIANY